MKHPRKLQIWVTAGLGLFAHVPATGQSEPEVRVNALTGCRLEVTASRQRTITCPRKLTFSSEDARRPLIERLKSEAGKDALECGVVGVGDSKDEAVACALDAERT